MLADQPPHRRRSEPSLVEACIRGDQNAWSEFVARYGRLVLSVPRRLGLPPEICDDVFQEVFETAFRKLPLLRDEKSLPKWLMTVAYHRSCRAGRRRGGPAPAPPREEPGPPDRELEAAEIQQRVREALAELGGNCRELLTALFMDRSNPAYEEISRRLGMPIGSIGPTRNRCLKKLLELLKDE